MAVIGKRVIHPGGRASTEALLHRAELTSSSAVLDVGCDVGTIAIAHRYGARVTAVGIDPLMLDRAATNVRAAHVGSLVTIEPGDILELVHNANGFDVVIAEAVTGSSTAEWPEPLRQ